MYFVSLSRQGESSHRPCDTGADDHNSHLRQFP
jgi:hypothetical protein